MAEYTNLYTKRKRKGGIIANYVFLFNNGLYNSPNLDSKESL